MGVLEVRINAEDSGPVAKVRFASLRAAESAMASASKGFISVGEGMVRARLPASTKDEWRSFVPPRAGGLAIDNEPKKKKLKPNERFASAPPKQSPEDLDESQRF